MSNGDGSQNFEEGYAQLKKRAGEALERLLEVEVSFSSVLTADDLYFHPIFRTFSQATVECLFSALDHLRVFSVESRKSREAVSLCSGDIDTNNHHRSLHRTVDGKRQHRS